MTRRAWILNLDAEHELEARGPYTPTKELRAIVARESRRLLGGLVGPDDVVLAGDDPPGGDGAPPAEGLPGFAWCPTPSALARLRAAGARPLAAPALAVLRRVNARSFAVQVRAPLAESSFDKHVATSLDEVLDRVSLPARDGWLVRRAFGAAGRGRRRLAAGKPSDAERAWIVASLRLGSVVIEPWVHVTREFTRSAWVGRDGSVVISAPCFQTTTAHGAWTGTDHAHAGDVARDDDARLEAAVSAAGTALAAEGYFGPFGIDAFQHRVPDVAGVGNVLNPLSEINARFTMDWAMAMGTRCGVERGVIDFLVDAP